MTKFKYPGSDMFARPTLPHSIGYANGGWSFPWVCQGRMVIPLGVSPKGCVGGWLLPWINRTAKQVSWVWHVCQTHFTLDLANCQAHVLQSGMFVKPTLPWTWRTTMSNCFRSGMFTRPTLPWIWLNIKSKYLEFDMFARPTLLYSLRCVKEGWSFSWTCQERIWSFYWVCPSLAHY
jgi:hypothetical protein